MLYATTPLMVLFVLLLIFNITGGQNHTIFNYQANPVDGIERSLYVKCKDSSEIIEVETFTIVKYDSSYGVTPTFNPSTVIQEPVQTDLTINTEDPSVCFYTNQTGGEQVNLGYETQNKISSYQKQHNTTINIDPAPENATTYYYNLTCMNPAGFITGPLTTGFNVDLEVPLEITLHSPQNYYSTTQENILLNLSTNKNAYCKQGENP